MVDVAKKRMLRFEGATSLRHRLVLSLLSGLPIRVSSIRADSTTPGLCAAEISFIRLVDKVSSGSAIHINDTGTVLVFRPGHLTGSPRGVLIHECHPSRTLSYYARPLLALAPFFKKPVRIVLRGVTHGCGGADACADSVAAVSAPLLRRLALGQSLSPTASVQRRAFADARGDAGTGAVGELSVTCGVLSAKLRAVDLVAAGSVKRIRGIAFASRTSPAALARMVDAARGVLNRFSPDVYIHTDHSGSRGATAGYGLHLVAETTDGCLLSADWSSTDASVPPERVAQTAVNLLLEEIAGGGCVDSDHAPLALLFCALADSEVSRVRVGSLSDSCVVLMRDLRDFFGVVFKVKVQEGIRNYESDDSDDSSSESDDSEEMSGASEEDEEVKRKSAGVKKAKGVKERGIVLSCVGIGHSNIARQRF